MKPCKKKQGCFKSFFLHLALSVLLAASLMLTGCSGQKGNSAKLPSPQASSAQSQEQNQGSQAPGGLSSDTRVHFIDVGQGLSVLAESDGRFLLYDGGDRKASALVVSYLKEQGVETLDYVIASHYDADHLNGVVGALNTFQVSQVLAPDYETDTKVFQSFQSAIKEKNIPLSHPSPGDSFTFGDASFTVLAPQNKSYQSANDYSVAIRLTVGDVSFLITGDAEVESEAEMVQSGLPLESTVYAVGHHGSASSSSWDLLQKSVPEYAVISCGTGNSYGHPHVETMEKLEAMEIPVFRTDRQGTITVSTDGTSLSWSAEPCNDYSSGDPDDMPARPAGSAQPGESSQENSFHTYILNTNSKLIHMLDCKNAADISEKNKQTWSGESYEKCLEEHPGYRGCKSCDPR